MSRNQNLVVGGLVAALAAAVVIWLKLRGVDGEPPVQPAMLASAAIADVPAAAGSGSAIPKARVRRLADPAGRTEMLRQIREVQAKRGSGAKVNSSSGSTTPAPALPAPTIDKDYIRASVRELIPLLVECYEQGLARDPKLAGSIIVDFTIEGEPGVGGVIGASAIDTEGSTLTDPAVRECVQETMFGIEIEPPDGGGIVNVRYPFEFRPSSE